MDFGLGPVQAMDRSGAVLTAPAGRLLPIPLHRLLGVFALLVLVAATVLTVAGGLSVGKGPVAVRSGEARPSAAAWGQISSALGAGDPAFRVVRTGGVLTAENSAQGLSARFDRGMVSVSATGLALDLSLRAFGWGASRTSVATSRPVARGNGVSYARAGLSEWYRNGPYGIEQGFTVARPPAGARIGPLTVAMELSGNVHAALSAGGAGLVLRAGSTSLRYGGLLATDASGRELGSSLSLHGRTLLLAVDAGGAHYPIKIDPLIQKGGKLTGTGEQGEGRFGSAAAASADGSTVLVGAPGDENSQGAAWVFARKGSEWKQQGPKLTAGTPRPTGSEEECAEEAGEDAGECAFGSSVALSADGDTALVGAPSPTLQPGAVFVFTREGSTWTRSATLIGPNAQDEGRFGRGVALSSDGATALIGDPSAANERGEAFTFTRADAGWALAATLSGPDLNRVAHFGRSVSLSSDGTTALVGGPGYLGFKGGAWAFGEFASKWSPLGATLTGQGATPEAHFGKSVALSGDGATALIGGMYDGGGRGAAWLFARSGSLFDPLGEKLVGEEETSHFGSSVALSGAGDVALVGAAREEHAVGSVTVLTRSGAAWTRLGEQLAGTGASGKGQAGMAVALSSTGQVAVSGAPRDNARVGGAWVFSQASLSAIGPPSVSAVAPGHGSTSGGTEVTITGAGFNAASAVSFGPVPAASFEVRSATTIKAITPVEPAGTVDVTVASSHGSSAPSPEFDSFTFQGPGGGSASVQPGAGAGGGAGGVPASGLLGFTGSGPAACLVSLRNKHLVVARRRSALLRLMRTGSGGCRGRVALRYVVRHTRHFSFQTIGIAGFSIAPGASQIVRIKLTKAGRKLFRARHGRLNATLAIIRVAPAPTLGRTARVRLSVKKTPRLKAPR